MRVEPAKALQARDLRRERRCQSERRDLPIEFVAATEFVFHQRGVFTGHDPILGRKRGILACEPTEPLVVRLPPRRALAAHEAAKREELEV